MPLVGAPDAGCGTQVVTEVAAKQDGKCSDCFRGIPPWARTQAGSQGGAQGGNTSRAARRPHPLGPYADGAA